MSRKVVLASFATDEDLLGAVRGARTRSWHIVDVYTPYPVHGLEEGARVAPLLVAGGVFGRRRGGRRPIMWFQFWTTAQDWPLDVGGRPWNSLPAFAPVAFECMVLFGGFSLVFAWMFRCRLFPGKKAVSPMASLTDDRFALVVGAPDAPEASAAVRQALHDCHAVDVQERDDEEPYK